MTKPQSKQGNTAGAPMTPQKKRKLSIFDMPCKCGRNDCASSVERDRLKREAKVKHKKSVLAWVSYWPNGDYLFTGKCGKPIRVKITEVR